MSAIKDEAQPNKSGQNEPAPKINKGTAAVWLVVCGGILTIAILNFNGGTTSPAKPIQVLARKAPEPRPATPVPTVTTNPAPAVAFAWPTFRVQAIFFSATRPAAMINGRTVFVNEVIDECRVAAIATNSVTLSGHGESRVLKFGR